MSMPDSEYYRRFQNLINGLVEKTRAAVKNGEKMWDAVGPDVYELTLQKSSMTIRSRDGDGTYPYIFELVDSLGKTVETLEDNPVDGQVELGPLYKVVTRGFKDKAVDDTITDILRELDLPDVPPF
jgi:hypothetical protein